MLKKYLFVILISALLPFKMEAEWVSLDKNKPSNTEPEVSIISDDNTGTVIKINLAGFDVREFESEGRTYKSVDLLSEIFSSKPGYPELSYLAKVLAIPDLSGISVEVLETSEIQTFSNIYLPPARTSWIEGAPESPYSENPEIYQSNEIYPKDYVYAEPPSIFRDFRISRISVYPIRYIPAKRELQAVSSITIRVNYGRGEVINPKTTPKKRIAPSFAKLYRSFIFNYQNVLDNLYGGKEDGHEVMLCIMPDAFVSSFQIYADWKRQSGTDIHVTKFSDIGANASNPDIIKTHIADAYHNWEFPPTYVLIVGDNGVFPKKIVTYPDYSFPNEDFFVEIDGNDYLPEMMIGRFTNESDYGMQVMIHKFLLYEKNPYTTNTSWFKKGVCCSNNDYDSQVETKRFAYHRMMDDGNFTSVDTLMSDGNTSGGGCTVHLSDVINAINNGRSYLNYRGEGWSYGWYASCYNFYTADVSSLNNGQKFTFVTSIGCGVAMFDTPGGNCFGEEWIEEGTLTNPKGAAAFIGPTSNTHTACNNQIDKGIYIGMFQEGLDTPGEALVRGKMYLYNVYGNTDDVEYHFKIFCVLGDPSIHIWKEVPLAINVDHPTSIDVGVNSLEFTITNSSTGQPMPNEELCLAGDDIFVTGTSDSTGKVYLEILPQTMETLTVTVRGGDVIPYQGTIEVIQEVQLVQPVGDPVIAELNGNMDGLINPNENFSITYTLKNWGYQTASNVQATLLTSQPDFVQIITTNPINFGNIASESSFTGSPFQFFVKPECPVGQTITLHLHVASTAYSWDYYESYEVMGCRLQYKNFVVQDDGSSNMNYRLDPGESAKLVISIKNGGEDVATDVMGILTSSNPYITIEDSIGSFGTLNINSIATNGDNYFEISVDPSCPVQYLAEFSVKLYTQNGNYPYQIIKSFNVPVTLPIPADYSGPDTYGYYAYASNDAFFNKTPVYNWFEIEGLGNQLNIPPNTSEFTENVSLPFNFKYYGLNYSMLRISTDGWVAPGGGNETNPVNASLPANDNVNNMIAVFWDDLYDYIIPQNGIFYYNDNSNHRFIIEWDSIAHNDTILEPQIESFQAILLDPVYYPTPTGDGEILFQYKKLTNTTSNTIGIENSTQDIGLQYVYNNTYDPTAAGLINEFAIRFTTDPPSISLITTGEENHELSNGSIISGSVLEQNIPNPFNSSTRINYTLAYQSKVCLTIYNIEGELVRTLQNTLVAAGKYAVDWNGLNDQGTAVGSGIYFYRLQTDGFTKTMKMFKMK